MRQVQKRSEPFVKEAGGEERCPARAVFNAKGMQAFEVKPISQPISAKGGPGTGAAYADISKNFTGSGRVTGTVSIRIGRKAECVEAAFCGFKSQLEMLAAEGV